MVWAEAKTWLVDHCWHLFALEKWKRRSQTFTVLLALACVMSLVALLVTLWSRANVHSWIHEGAVTLVPMTRVVQINGQAYIPIRMLT